MKNTLAIILLALLFAPASFAHNIANNDPKSIVDLVVSNPNVEGDEDGDFDILLAAVQNADPSIAEALTDQELTVFAPTDIAFTNLLAQLDMSADELLANKDLLNSVLMFHVTEGRHEASAVTSMAHVTMLDGNKAAISMKDGGAYINESKIIATDVEGGNGLVHVIDAVLLPPSK